MANEREEVCPELAAAVGRLALLIAAVQADRFFTDGPAEWLASLDPLRRPEPLGSLNPSTFPR